MSTIVAHSASTIDSDDRNVVQSLVRGLALLQCFDPESPELGISELSRRTALTKRSAYRLAVTLERLGYLVKVPSTRRYRLGVRILDLGFALLSTMGPREAARPWLEWLLGFGGEAANLAILDGPEIIYVDHVKRPGSGIRMDIPVGSRRPAHYTSTGKALLATLPPEQLELILARLDFTPRTPKSVPSPEALRQQLKETRRAGFALSDGEMTAAVRGIAAPVFGRDNAVVGSINVLAFAATCSTLELKRDWAPRVCEAARRISETLGYRATNMSTAATRP